MAKKITNTYHEPIVLWLLQPKGMNRLPQRTSVNLLPGDDIDRDPSGNQIKELSPEVEKLRLKGYVQVEDVEDVESAPAEPPPTVVHEPETRQVEAEGDYDADLEAQLLDENE